MTSATLTAPYPVVQLRSGRDKPLDWGHPWVFSGAVQKVERGTVEGSIVTVLDSKGVERGVALYGSKTIALKFLSRERGTIDEQFFRNRLASAFGLRRDAGLFADPATNCFRLFFAEGDGIPGLIVDRYDRTAVIQFQEQGLQPFAETIAQLLVSLSGGTIENVYQKDKEEGGRYLAGTFSETVVTERGIRYPVDWERGQKTGFFLDQRENRSLLRRYAAGRQVLNCFSYTGGFSLNAAAGGATRVISVDSSEWALEMLRRGKALNAGGVLPAEACLEEIREDCFDYLTANRDQFDLVVLDPPAFVKHRSAIDQGLRGYQQLNALGMKAVKRGGLIFTFSCSQLVSKEQFRRTIFEAALSSKRRVRILHEMTQAPCHPIQIFFPEGEYLKGYVLYIDEE